MNTQPEALRLADAVRTHEYHPQYRMYERVASELRRLHQHEKALQEWLDKTEWVQTTSRFSELGMHRADVMRYRIEQADSRERYLSEKLEEKDKEIAYLLKVIAAYHAQHPELAKTLSSAFSNYGQWVGSQ